MQFEVPGLSAGMFSTVLTYTLSGDVFSSAHSVSWVLRGVMGPLNLAHDLTVCHSDLYLCVVVL